MVVKKEEKTEKKKKNKLVRILIFLVLVLILLFLYSKKIEVGKLTVKEYKIESKNIPQSFSGIKIAHFSDLNYGSSIYEKELKHIVDKINEINPDLVIFTGNIFSENYKYTKSDIELIVSYFNNIDSEIGKYAVKGQNDYNIENIDIELANAKFNLLENSYDLIYYKGFIPIYIGGLSSYLTTRIDLDKTLEYYKEADDETTNEEDPYKANYKIIICSESDAASEILNYDDSIDLILTGNTLGGIINIPYFGPLFKLEGSKNYNEEYYLEGNTEIYVNSGLGTNKYKLRLFNKPSINFYRLKSN